jgi:hypothetical protein
MPPAECSEHSLKRPVASADLLQNAWFPTRFTTASATTT